jgi:hypothetical protein
MSSIRALSILFVALAPLVACAASTSESDLGETSQALECDASGTWAIKIETPVKWNSSFVLQGGTGVVTNWLLSNRTQQGLAITDSADLCGVETPDYQAAALFGGEKYGVQFPENTFGSLPKVTLTGALSSRDVGATFSTPASAALIGATLANPTTDAWPSNVANLVAVDIDNDGKPGISADAKTGPGLSLPPVNATRSVRANRVYTAFRQVLASTAGTVTSCTRVEGKGSIAVIAGKAALDSHVMGCRRADGTDCNASEYKLLDSAAPVYQPTGDATITMVKLPTNAAATCSSVRALDFAAQN